MANAATKTKQPDAPAAAEATPASMPTRRAQTLRSAQTKQFVPSSLQTLGLGDFDLLTQQVPADWTFEDCMKPIAWARVASKVARDAVGQNTRDYTGSTIKLIHPKFYADVLIRKVVRDHMNNPNGLEVICIGPAQDKNGRGCPRDLETGLPWADPVAIEQE